MTRTTVSRLASWRCRRSQKNARPREGVSQHDGGHLHYRRSPAALHAGIAGKIRERFRVFRECLTPFFGSSDPLVSRALRVVMSAGGMTRISSGSEVYDAVHFSRRSAIVSSALARALLCWCKWGLRCKSIWRSTISRRHGKSLFLLVLCWKLVGVWRQARWKGWNSREVKNKKNWKRTMRSYSMRLVRELLCL